MYKDIYSIMRDEFMGKLRALFKEYDAVLTVETYHGEAKYMEIDIYDNGHNRQTIYLGGEFKHDTPL